MNETFDQHKLAAVFYADIAGYSRLTAQDERGSHRRVMETLDFVSDSIANGGGKVLRYAGDAILAEFPSVLRAVRTSIDIQQALAQRNQPLPERDRALLRIGINLGEVLQDRGELYGDGVNLAARLEAAARPGGLCVSALVYDQVNGRIDCTFNDGGEQQFKNIAAPVRVYHWSPGDPQSAADEIQGALELPTKPSVAILPFENMSNDAEQDFFADGISEDIITELSKFRSLFVIARNSSFAFRGQSLDMRDIGRKLGVRYVVEGSVRRAGNRIRVTAQLIDALEDKHLWAERYDRDLEDIFAVQDEVTQAIVTTIEPQLIISERSLARRKPAQNLNAWEAYQRGIWHIYQYTAEDNFKALEFLDKAVSLDPGFAPAHAGIAFSLYVHIIMDTSENRAADLQRGLEAGLRAVKLDELDPFAYVGLGRIRIVRAEHAQAIADFDRAIDLNPSFAIAYYGKAHCMWHCGRAAEAVDCHDEAMRLSPRDPLMWTFLASKSIALFMLERYEESLECAHRAQQYPMSAIWAYMGQLATLGATGRQAEAAQALARALELKPDLRLQFVREALPITHAPSADRFYGALGIAGVPA